MDLVKNNFYFSDVRRIYFNKLKIVYSQKDNPNCDRKPFNSSFAVPVYHKFLDIKNNILSERKYLGRLVRQQLELLCITS